MFIVKCSLYCDHILTPTDSYFQYIGHVLFDKCSVYHNNSVDININPNVSDSIRAVTIYIFLILKGMYFLVLHSVLITMM